MPIISQRVIENMDSIITGMTGVDEEFKVGYILDFDIISIIAVKCILPIYLNGLKSTQIRLNSSYS